MRGIAGFFLKILRPVDFNPLAMIGIGVGTQKDRGPMRKGLHHYL
jgi:hypothetical protein